MKLTVTFELVVKGVNFIPKIASTTNPAKTRQQAKLIMTALFLGMGAYLDSRTYSTLPLAGDLT
ncbi:hypothetical protein DTL42_11700 [Bremerella cremea]|uniref:Uncharacterized protein n=1 Tax=Bremerella cremea TaxID=1031537 RepID=A0A368KUA2_9BACT|nr:hypothetical protein DTL42_11700 [Bremerella cremea]